ncbi:MAG: helix-turn-helix transcriptional regulator [Candidatus Binatia bacterium]
MRLKRGWTQRKLAEECGLEQGTISRIENPDYGQLSFETVLAVARGFDCAFIGRFVPFSQLRALVEDSSEEGNDIASAFEEEDATCGDMQPRGGLRLLAPPAILAANIVGKDRRSPHRAKSDVKYTLEAQTA